MRTDPMEIPSIADQDLERHALLLETSCDYRVLRRLKRPATSSSYRDVIAGRSGIFVDVETTGLDPVDDEIIELAMLAFTYSTDGSFCIAGESFEGLRDPGKPIPSLVTDLTGIDDAMVSGKSIDLEEVWTFVRNVDLIVAHNAAFDRQFCERFCGVFSEKPWACSFREIDWKNEGFEGAKLGQIAAGHGLFFDGHRAFDDCVAGLEILSRELPRSRRPALAVLLESARRPQWRIRAIDAPFAARSILKSRNYRWNDGSNGAPRAWYVDVDESALDAETDFLRQSVYGRHVVIDARRFTALDRYSERCR